VTSFKGELQLNVGKFGKINRWVNIQLRTHLFFLEYFANIGVCLLIAEFTGGFVF